MDVSGLDSTCDGPEGLPEAIEFAIRNDTSRDGHWIPLRLSYYDNETFGSSIEIVRGYQVLANKWPLFWFTEKVNICGDTLQSNEIQFRWMGTAGPDAPDERTVFRQDMWALAGVTATYITENETNTLIQDHFGTGSLK